MKIFRLAFWILWRKNCIPLDLRALFSWKPCAAFWIAQCKHRRLVNPCLNSDLYFISKTSGTALLETVVSYKLLPSLSQENKKPLSQHFLTHQQHNSLMCIFPSILNWKANQKNSIMSGWKYRSKGLLKAMFCHQNSNKKADRLWMKFSSTSNASV